MVRLPNAIRRHPRGHNSSREEIFFSQPCLLETLRKHKIVRDQCFHLFQTSTRVCAHHSQVQLQCTSSKSLPGRTCGSSLWSNTCLATLEVRHRGTLCRLILPSWTRRNMSKRVRELRVVLHLKMRLRRSCSCNWSFCSGHVMYFSGESRSCLHHLGFQLIQYVQPCPQLEHHS